MKFKTILADPPWKYKSPGIIGNTLDHRCNRDSGLARLGAGSEARYGAMTLEQIKGMDVKALAEDASHLYLWTTNSFMVEAHEVSRAWGFEPKTIITWVKTKPDGSPSMKMGYYYRGATEHLLFCTRGAMRLRGPASPTALLTRRLGHSVKPEESFKLIEQQSPGPYLELFCRNPRPGWSAWGNQVTSDIVVGTL